jgi:hypothetical protein
MNAIHGNHLYAVTLLKHLASVLYWLLAYFFDSQETRKSAQIDNGTIWLN